MNMYYFHIQENSKLLAHVLHLLSSVFVLTENTTSDSIAVTRNKMTDSAPDIP